MRCSIASCEVYVDPCASMTCLNGATCESATATCRVTEGSRWRRRIMSRAVTAIEPTTSTHASRMWLASSETEKTSGERRRRSGSKKETARHTERVLVCATCVHRGSSA